MAAWQNFLDNFSGQAEFQAQKQGEQIQAEIDYYNTPEGQRAAQIGGGIMAAMLPIPGSRLLGAGRAAKPVIDKMYGAVGKDMSRMIIPPLTKPGRSLSGLPPLRSGARVGQDAIRSQKDLKNMDPLERLLIPPLTKPGRQLTTVRGPRGPINVEQPTQLPLRLEGARNTRGLSDTDKAMIDWMLPKGTGRYRAKEVDKVKWNKDRYPRKSDRILNRRPANAQEVEIIKDLAKKGFYDKPKPKPEGIMNTPSAKSSLSKVKSTNIKELTNRRNALRSEEFRLNSMRSQGEATQADMNKYHRIKAEIEAIDKLLK